MAEAPKTQPNAPAVKQPSYLLRWFLQYYLLVTVAGCFLILVLGYFLVISPKLTRARSVEAVKLAAETERQKNLENKLEYLVALSKKRSQMSEADIKKIATMLPEEAAIPELFATLEAIAKESQVTVEGIDVALLDQSKPKAKDPKAKESPSAVALPPGVRGLEVSLTVAGTTYDILKKLLANIEHSLRLLDVVSLMYTPSAKTYNITMRTYYLGRE